METAVAGAGAGAGAAVGEVTKCSIVHAEREFGYLVHFKRNKTNLLRILQQLTATTNDVQRLVDAAVNNTALIRDSVQTWLASAATAQEAGTQLIDEAAQVNSWFKGWCCSRFSIGRRAAKMIPRIQGLLDEGKSFGEIVSDPMPAQSLPLVSHGDFMEFPSRDFTKNQVLNALKDEGINLVGVHGMPGMGKTMLVKALASHLKEEKMFEEVVTVIVSAIDMKKIQVEIAKRLSLRLEDDDSISLRADRLTVRLNQGKKTLVILDDLWQRVELSELGIHWKKDRNTCKVLFTTRSVDVCNSMESAKIFEVTLLSQEDSWSLFREKAGPVVESTPLQSVVQDVLNECRGLPFAIVTIGRALRDKNANVWAAALALLKKSSSFQGMTPVISSIRLSYDFLLDPETQLCFLFCGLFPERFVIKFEVLLWYLMGENKIGGVDTLEAARGRLHLIVDKLISSGLLLKYPSGEDDPACMMHDVVRDAAIQIASEENEENHGFIVKARMNLTEWRPDMELEKCKRLSLMSNNIIRCVFPSQIRAPLLLTLSLSDNWRLKEISGDLFSEMKSLLTLDLSRTAIKLLPPSLSCLVNLRTLLLKDCHSLESVSPIESLEKLEILDLSACFRIEELPEELGGLTNLKLLHLWDMYNLNTISPNLISNLSRLEELNVTPFCSWEIDETGEGRNASLSEIMSLTRLTSLRIRITNLACLYMNTISNHWRNMSRFTILAVEDLYRYMFDLLNWNNIDLQERNLALQLSSSVCVADWVRMLLEVTNCLFLFHCDCLESVAQLYPTGLTDGLKILCVRNCHGMRHLLGSSSSSTGVQQESQKYALRNLEELEIGNVENFEAICEGTLPDEFLCKLTKLAVQRLGNKIRCLIPSDLLQRLQKLQELKVSWCFELDMLHPDMSSFSSSSSPIFPNLRSVSIERCPKLKYIFPVGVFRHLLQLKRLEVIDCEEMEVIISDDNDEVVQVPQLELIYLRELPSLTSFSRRNLLVVNLPALEDLSVIRCMSLKRLPLTTNSVPKLERLFVDSEEGWFDGLEWEDQSLKARLETLLVKSYF